MKIDKRKLIELIKESIISEAYKDWDLRPITSEKDLIEFMGDVYQEKTRLSMPPSTDEIEARIERKRKDKEIEDKYGGKLRRGNLTGEEREERRNEAFKSSVEAKLRKYISQKIFRSFPNSRGGETSDYQYNRRKKQMDLAIERFVEKRMQHLFPELKRTSSRHSLPVPNQNMSFKIDRKRSKDSYSDAYVKLLNLMLEMYEKAKNAKINRGFRSQLDSYNSYQAFLDYFKVSGLSNDDFHEIYNTIIEDYPHLIDESSASMSLYKPVTKKPGGNPLSDLGITESKLMSLIRESIDKQTKDLTKKAGADMPSEIESDFGGGQKDIVPGDDFEVSEPVQTSRRSFLKLMASIGAALGIGGGAALVSKRRSSTPLTDEELFQRAGFTKEKNLLIPYAGFEGEPIDMGGHHYKKVQEILPGTNVTIKIHPGKEGMFTPEIGLQWSPTDNLAYIEDYDADYVVGTASEVLEYIGGKGLNNIMDEYFKALEEKNNMALESIRRAEEIYQGHEIFDLNDKDSYHVYNTYGDGDLYYWWAHFIHAFGVPKRVECAENIDKPWFKLVEAGMQVDQLIDGKDIPVPPEGLPQGMDKGIMWAKTGTFNGKRVVIFQSFEVIQFSVFLD